MHNTRRREGKSSKSLNHQNVKVHSSFSPNVVVQITMRSSLISRRISSKFITTCSLLCLLTHKYSNHVSLEAIAESFDDVNPANNDIADEVEEIPNLRNQSIQPASDDKDDHDQVKQLLRTLIGTSCYFVNAIMLTL